MVRTVSGLAMRVRSLRTMSTIITFSARFLAQLAKRSACRKSSATVSPRPMVPFIGIELIVSPSRRKKSSGDSETIAQSGVCRKPPYSGGS